jgi:hypothetical protein
MKYKSKANMTFRLRDGRRIEPGDEFDVDPAEVPGFMRVYFEEVTTTDFPVFVDEPVYEVQQPEEEVFETANEMEAVETAPGWYKLRDKVTGELSEKSYRISEVEGYV